MPAIKKSKSRSKPPASDPKQRARLLQGALHAPQPLTMDSQAKRNIVIVELSLPPGGGIIGSTTAYFLTRHPKYNPSLHRITILEASSVAAGASGKAGGLLALWAYPSSLVPLSYRLHKELAAEHGGDKRWGYRRVGCGSFEARVTKQRLEELRRRQAAVSTKTEVNGGGGEQDEGGKGWEKLPKKDENAESLLEESVLPRDLDWIDRESVHSYAEMGSPGATETAQVHPFHFTTSMAALAQDKGVEVRTMAQMTKIIHHHHPATSEGAGSPLRSVEYLDRESGETRTIDGVTDVLIAAGPWTGRLVPGCKVTGLRAHSVVYDADVSPYAVFTSIELPSDFVPEHRASKGQKRRHKRVVDPEIYARPFGEVYACGEPDKNVPLPDTADKVQVDEANCDDIISYIATFSPALAAAPVKAKQACYLPQVDYGPLVGPTSVPGLWLASGHTCWGIQNGPATGKLMSEYIFDGEATSSDISDLDPRKYKV
ncbi:putative FAD dependent oxidoreductase [Colletotrichum karsti]|uniref:FAD dependent oxidoreductase n=1 Tax=Colletotrichum karsti TaxID=1095194 RepID=A0A9P6IEZ6_9PEZI|nr:putative FAD dependent oxidoreductase [Colletotrichum karsti]KAF9881214.1 putative FAD dependent oxidoreductase [Colletotrichum karsti]